MDDPITSANTSINIDTINILEISAKPKIQALNTPKNKKKKMKTSSKD